ncbi:MAG: hypothetical protein IKZ48_01060 [Prevotella sp.]|nr:hypothetical protein [Prevotella sp.]
MKARLFIAMTQQQHTRARPDGGLMITQETVVGIVMRKLQVYGRETAQRDFEALDSVLSDLPGWAATKKAVEDIFFRDNQQKRQESVERDMELTRMLQYGFMSMSQMFQKGDSHPVGNHTEGSRKPDISDEHICRCLEQLMAEEWRPGKPLFCQQSHWQAVFRILSDFGKFADDDFDGFDSWVLRVVPAQLRLLYSKQSVKNISQTLFNKQFDKWTYDSQLMKKRTPYDRMEQIARRFKELLEGRD